MSRLLRYTQQLFGINATGSRIAVFGSLAAGSPTAYNGATITPSLVQSQLGQFQQGLDGCVIGVSGGESSPPLQDHNALFYLYAYQLAYTMQQGIPEYDGSTTYYKNSLVMVGSSPGAVYKSIADNNTGNDPLATVGYWSNQELFLNVRDYGASGDGSHDDTTMIQAALDALDAGGGGGLLFPPGTYRLTGRLSIPSNTTLIGESKNSVLLYDGSVPSSPAAVLYCDGVENVGLTGLKLVGNQTVGSAGLECLRINGGSGFTVTDCQITGPADGTGFNIGMNVITATSVKITGCLFSRMIGNASGGGYGVLVQSSCQDVDVSDNSFDFRNGNPQDGRHAIYLSSGTSHSKACRNCIIGTYGESISTNCLAASQPEMVDILISDNQIVNPVNAGFGAATGGIFIGGFIRNFTVSNNTIVNSNSMGIMLQAESAGSTPGVPRYGLITGNNINSSAANGIFSQGPSFCTFSGNTIQDFNTAGSPDVWNGITITDQAGAGSYGEGNAVIGNYVIQTGAPGIQGRSLITLTSGVADTFLSGNRTFPGNVSNGQIDDSGVRTVYEGQRFFDRNISGTVLGSASWTDVISITLPAGDWDVSGVLAFSYNSGTVATVGGAISIYSGNTTTDQEEGDNVGYTTAPVSGGDTSVSIPSYQVLATTATTVYLKGFTDGTSPGVTSNGRLSARRMTENYGE